MGVKSFHAKNMIHTNIHPENILLDEENNIKIGNFFGQAKIYLYE